MPPVTRRILKGFAGVISVILISGVLVGSAGGAYLAGYLRGISDTPALEKEIIVREKQVVQQEPSESPKQVITRRPRVTWTGPELWELVNKRRVELGVNPLSTKDEICTVSSLRLNELLASGKLDGHEGFSSLPERREDLAWIYERYSLTEFLLSGAQTPQEAVSLWENTLGHKKLLTGGEYVWGCIYAQDSFAVAITAF